MKKLLHIISSSQAASVQPAIKKNVLVSLFVSVVVLINTVQAQTASLSLNAQPAHTCAGGSIGSVILSATGGTAPYKYDLFNHSFPGKNLNTSLLDIRNGNFSCNNGLVASYVTTNPGRNSTDNSVASKDTIADNGYVRYEASFNFQDGASVYFGFANSSNGRMKIPIGFQFNQGVLKFTVDGNTYTDAASQLTGVSYDYRIIKAGNDVQFFTRKTTDKSWRLVAVSKYTGTNISYKIGVHYLGDPILPRGFTSKNWIMTSNPPVSGLSAGTYQFSVTDNSGAVATQTVVIDGSLPYNVAVATTNTTVTNGTNGSVSFSSSPAISYVGAKVFSETFAADYNASLFSILNGDFVVGTDLRANPTSVLGSWSNSISNNTAFVDRGFLRYESSFSFDETSQVFFGLAASTKSIINFGDQLISFYYNKGILNTYVNGVPTAVGAYAPGTWYDFKIEKVGTAVRYFTRATDEDWKMVANVDYAGSVTSFKASAQYYSNGFEAGGFNSKNWNVYASAQTTNLPAGEYNYFVVSEGGCSNDVVFSIYDPIVFTATSVAASCFGYADGKINFNIKGGKAPYKYSLDDGRTYLVATNNVLEGVAAGSYKVRAMDVNGMVSPSQTIVVGQPAQVIANITTINKFQFCVGGSVDITASVGAAYEWSNGATTQTINVTAPGSYSVKVTDATGCSNTSAPVVVAEKALPVTTITPNAPTTFCQGGSVKLAAAGGGSYRWSTGQTTNDITVSSAGSYSVTATNADGCSATSEAVQVVVNPKPVVVISADGPLEFCAGGSVTLTASEGTRYVWSNGSTDRSITVSAAGRYTVTVFNEFNCSTSTYRDVIVNALPAASVSPAGVVAICAGSSTQLSSVSAASYLWNTNETTQRITVSTAGNYSVTVTNDKGCSATSNVTTVVVNALPVAGVTVGGPTTFCTGSSVDLTGTGGVSYLWNTGATTATLTARTTGSYSVKVTDANGCSSISAAVSVTALALPVATITPATSLQFCDGGDVKLMSSPGVSYQWSGTTSFNQSADNSFIIAINSGSYTVKVTDVNGCSNTSAPAVVTENPLPVAQITASGATTFCQGASVTLTASPASKYAWSNGATTSSISVATSGKYSVKVTDAKGCMATSNEIQVTVNPVPTASVSVVGATTFCAGGSVTLNATGGSTYTWSNGSTGATLVATTSGSYSVTSANSFGCTAKSTATVVTVNPAPVPVVSPSGNVVICAGSTRTLAASGGKTYLWNTGATTSSIVISTPGTFNVKVTDDKGCSATSANIVATVNQLPVVSLTSNNDNYLCSGVQLSAQSTTANNTFTWSNGVTAPSINLTGADKDGVYTVTATDAAGCKSTTPASYSFAKQNITEAYTIVGINGVNLGANTRVATGSVGSTNGKGIITVGSNSWIASAGAFAKGRTVNVMSGANVPTKIQAAATITLPSLAPNTANPGGFPNTTVSSSASVAGNYSNITIKAGVNAMLTGDVFGTVTVEQGANVTFTANVINIDRFIIGSSTATSTSAMTTVRFADLTDVKVSEYVNVYSRCDVNGQEARVTFHMGDTHPDSESFTVNGTNTKVAGRIIMPIGTLTVTGAASGTTQTIMAGQFIALSVNSSGSNVIWQGRSCTAANTALRTVAPQPTVQQEEKPVVTAPVETKVVAQPKVELVEQKLVVKAWPNPTTAEFTLQVSGSSNEKATVYIVSATGNVVETYSNVAGGSAIKVGRNLSSGTYYAQVVQGDTRSFVQLVKIK